MFLYYQDKEFLSTLSLRRATKHSARISTRGSNFYPRSPCGERHILTITICTVSKFLSTLSLRRATVVGDVMGKGLAISIHALLAESDVATLYLLSVAIYFYPRSPCGERLRVLDGSESSIKISIHALLAESDTFRQLQSALCGNFYPRSPCGERRAVFCFFYLDTIISIHALLAESDLNGFAILWNTCISIHALLAESDKINPAS